MNKGIEILLSRMGSHPEEFFTDLRDVSSVGWRPGGRWSYEIAFALSEHSGFSEEEREELRRKLRELQQESFTQLVMTKLFEVPNKPSNGYNLNAGQLGSTVNGIGSITLTTRGR